LFFLFECEQINLNQLLFSEIKEYLYKIEIEIISGKDLNYKIISTYLQIILLKLKQFMQVNCDKELQGKSKDKFYRDFYLLLENNFLIQRKSIFYAESMHINIRVLNRILKQKTGKTSSRLIRERILLEIKRLLLDFTLSIKEISVILNFTDISHFSKFFIKETGIKPLDFRKKV
jgi:AraC-like DNA-binding protein